MTILISVTKNGRERHYICADPAKCLAEAKRRSRGASAVAVEGPGCVLLWSSYRHNGAWCTPGFRAV
jgi:hypothetical protein